MVEHENANKTVSETLQLNGTEITNTI